MSSGGGSSLDTQHYPSENICPWLGLDLEDTHIILAKLSSPIRFVRVSVPERTAANAIFKSLPSYCTQVSWLELISGVVLP